MSSKARREDSKKEYQSSIYISLLQIKTWTQNKHPKIVVKRGVFDKTIAYNIEREIDSLFDPRSNQLPTVLIICPLKRQIEAIEKGLRARGFQNIDARQKQEEDIFLEGFNLLLKDSSCNLAWRVLFEAVCERTGALERFEEVTRRSFDGVTAFHELLTTDEKAYQES